MSRIASIIYIFLFSTISLVTAANFSLDVKFNLDECYNRTLELIKNRTLALNDDVFFRDNRGRPMVHPDNITLTLPGCRKLLWPETGVVLGHWTSAFDLA